MRMSVIKIKYTVYTCMFAIKITVHGIHKHICYKQIKKKRQRKHSFTLTALTVALSTRGKRLAHDPWLDRFKVASKHRTGKYLLVFNATLHV